ncbi:hypothetical protein STEG23_024718 [Scotinomys teguina]
MYSNTTDFHLLIFEKLDGKVERQGKENLFFPLTCTEGQIKDMQNGRATTVIVQAGYMSGMLVPVGVGIAGALFILGALYSIKVMNRRRRNGFKRHRRKQREFNSMQDRVMLLADSSEDEF